jgi:hypothetical protein
MISTVHSSEDRDNPVSSGWGIAFVQSDFSIVLSTPSAAIGDIAGSIAVVPLTTDPTNTFTEPPNPRRNSKSNLHHPYHL